MKVVITLNDVESAVRLNALLEKSDADTVMVSPIDDVAGTIRREKPEVIVVTGNLADSLNVQIAKSQLWEGAAVVGLADVDEPVMIQRLRAAGYTEIHPKPTAIADIASSVKRLAERRALQREIGLIGESEAIREVLVKVEQMAPVSSIVLIEGESGTGKELVARGIHRLSPRRGKPFIAVNVGALPETLLESELFGHEKGSFTGAAERRIGRFELAHTGTLFLDEIGEIPASTQVKLLRVLEERELMRVGGTEPLNVNVRVLAATNQPLREAVEAGTFRADLFYRLNVLRIYLPPLRERKEDVPVLVRRFVNEFSKAHDRPFHGISSDAMARLQEYPWPGNVRELRNLVESMVVLSPGREIQISDLPKPLLDESGPRFLPVHVGPMLRAAEGSTGRELEFIVRSLVELKLQVEELRRRMDDNGERGAGSRFIGEVHPEGPLIGVGMGSEAGGTGRVIGSARIEPRDAQPDHSFMVVPGMSMEDIERQAIQAALKETHGNRRRAAELLGIGERTLYRKLREYQLVP